MLQSPVASAGEYLRLQGFAILLLTTALLLMRPPQLSVSRAGDLPGRLAAEDGLLAVEADAARSAALQRPWSTQDIVERPVDDPPLVPRALGTLNVHLGPNENYMVVGLVPKAAKLDIVGRDETGSWLAIVFTPGSTFHGWVPRSRVSGVTNFDELKVVPVTLPAP